MPATRFDQRLTTLRKLDPKMGVTFTAGRKAVRSMRGLLAKPVQAGRLRDDPFKVARAFIRANKALLRQVDEEKELVDGRVMADRRDRTHVVFKQRLGDAEVIDGGVSVHFDADGRVYMMKSNLTEKLDLDPTPSLDADKAVEIALDHAGRGARATEHLEPTLSIVSRETLKARREPRPYILCWKLTVLKEKGPDWIYLVDANDGRVLMRYPSDQTGTGVGYYSTGTGLISESFTEADGSTAYRLRDEVTSSPWPVVTKPALHTLDDAGSMATGLTDYSIDDDDDWETTMPPRVDDQRPEVDVHRFLQDAADYYLTTFGYNGLDGDGLDPKGHAHNEKYNNNAFWSGSTEQVYFADGDGATRDFMCPLDTVMHEYSHGVKSYLDVLQVYSSESGALNEATSDIFGAFLALHHPTEDPWPWHHGRQYRLDGTVGRNMMDPARDDTGTVQYDATSDATKKASFALGFYPDHYSERFQGNPWSAWDDYDGVHWNCPIITHALYLMIEGGTHRLSNVTVNGIGVGPVEEIVWEALSTGLLTNTSDFADFRLACILACQTLYPENLDYLASVKAAFHAIGVGPDLFVRDTSGDDGDEPGTLSCMSPDIIARRSLADAATLGLMADLGNGSLGEDIEFVPGGSSDHYVYFRVQNRGAAAAPGGLRLFISPVSTFPTPASWTEVGYYEFGTVPAETGVWVPGAADQCITLEGSVIDALGTGHFCFIGVIESDLDPAPDYNLISDTNEFHDFIRKSNNYAWRNTDIEVVTADSGGEFAETENAFRLNGFGKGRQHKVLEVDTRALPRDTELVMWIPAKHYFGLKVKELYLRPEPVGLRRAARVDALREPVMRRAERTPMRLATMAPEELHIDRELVDRYIRRREYPVAVPAGKVLTLRGFPMADGEHLDLNFTVKFPRQAGARKVVLGFRERYKDEVIGQMNYVYRLMPHG